MARRTRMLSWSAVLLAAALATVAYLTWAGGLWGGAQQSAPGGPPAEVDATSASPGETADLDEHWTKKRMRDASPAPMPTPECAWWQVWC